MKLLDWILIVLVLVSLMMFTQSANMIVLALIFAAILFYRRLKWQKV